MSASAEPKAASTTGIVVWIVLLLLALGGASVVVVTVIQKANLSDRRSSDMANLSQIGKALVMYPNVSGNMGSFPPSLDLLYPDYVKDERVFLSPLVPDGEHLPGPGTLRHCDYFYIPGYKLDAGAAVIAFGPGSGDGRNVLVAAGSVEWLDESANAKFVQAYEDHDISLEFDVDLSNSDRARLRALRRELGLDKQDGDKSETP